MKKMLFVIITMLAMPHGVKADTLIDQFYAGFVGHAKLAIESNTDGKVRPEFLDNFLEVGKLKGDHIVALDFGILGTILPNSGQLDSADFTTGAKVHLAPVIKSYVNLPEQWAFLNTIEIDARASYNWREHHPFYGIVAGYPFK